MRFLRYIGGNNINMAIKTGKYILFEGKKPIINYVKEESKNKYQVYQEYTQINQKLDENYNLAIKLSSLNFDYNLISSLIDKYIDNNISIFIDAEKSSNNTKYNELCNILIEESNYKKINIYKTYQMYRKDSLKTLREDIEYFNKKNVKLGVKLVRGAYYFQDKNENTLFKYKNETDLNYNIAILLTYSKNINTILATHNDESINLGILLNNYNDKSKPKFKFAHLLDMKTEKYNYLKNEHTVYTYIPYGPYNEIIPYLIRRLYENLDYIKYMLK